VKWPWSTAGSPGPPLPPAPAQRLLLGTFTGVFTPTLLTIFGVIMFLRVGWSVGNAGLLGAWLVMLLALGITIATGLSLSSIATNTRIGPGGPYAIMGRSLGYEVGGSIGIPLYLTRPLGVAMYIIGFREGWLWIFPDHPGLVIDLVLFALLTGISYLSADLAFKLQYVILGIVGLAIAAVFLSPATFAEPAGDIAWWGEYPGSPEDGFASGASFWLVFAVFFPATTGILAGANMSGDLRDPRRAIPTGTLAAIAVSSVVYLGLAWWCARVATPEELVTNYTIAIDKSLWPPLVMLGLLGATASSALVGLVDGPRILMAMGQNKILPYSAALARTDARGNPRIAIVVTSALTLVALMVRDLNAIAPLVTMFFLITYGMLNFVVLFEQGLGLVSFRPTLRIPRLIPLLGLAGCIFSMFIVNPTFGLFGVGLTIAFYIWIQRQAREDAPEDEEDLDGVRSTVFVSMAQWAASRVTEAQHYNVRAWKPNIVVAVTDPAEVRGEYDLLLDLSLPDGSITLLGLDPGPGAPLLRERLQRIAETFRARGVQSAGTVVRLEDPVQAVAAGIDALQAAFFKPNALLITQYEEAGPEGPWLTLLARLSEDRIGAMVVVKHPKAGFGRRAGISLWIKPPPGGGWEVERAFERGNVHLSLLMAYRLMRQWKASLDLICVVDDASDAPAAAYFLRELADLARYPSRVGCSVEVGTLDEALERHPAADLNIFGLPSEPDFPVLYARMRRSRATCLFVRDSGRESALV